MRTRRTSSSRRSPPRARASRSSCSTPRTARSTWWSHTSRTTSESSAPAASDSGPAKAAELAPVGSRGNEGGMSSPAESAPARESTEHVRELVARGQQGDRDALEELYLIHFDRIYSYLHISVGNRHDAEDLTTQTFLKMLEKIGTFKWRAAPFSAWLFRIAHNLAMDHFRAQRRWQPEEDVPEPPGEEEPSAAPEAMQTIGRQPMLKRLDRPPPGQQPG